MVGLLSACGVAAPWPYADDDGAPHADTDASNDTSGSSDGTTGPGRDTGRGQPDDAYQEYLDELRALAEPYLGTYRGSISLSYQDNAAWYIGKDMPRCVPTGPLSVTLSNSPEPATLSGTVTCTWEEMSYTYFAGTATFTLTAKLTQAVSDYVEVDGETTVINATTRTGGDVYGRVRRDGTLELTFSSHHSGGSSWVSSGIGGSGTLTKR
jgi:hypothetical protein